MRTDDCIVVQGYIDHALSLFLPFVCIITPNITVFAMFSVLLFNWLMPSGTLMNCITLYDYVHSLWNWEHLSWYSPNKYCMHMWKYGIQVTTQEKVNSPTQFMHITPDDLLNDFLTSCTLDLQGKQFTVPLGKQSLEEYCVGWFWIWWQQIEDARFEFICECYMNDIMLRSIFL